MAAVHPCASLGGMIDVKRTHSYSVCEPPLLLSLAGIARPCCPVGSEMYPPCSRYVGQQVLVNQSTHVPHRWLLPEVAFPRSLSTCVCSLRPLFLLPSPPCLQILDLAWRCCQVADGPGLTAAWANGLLAVVVDLPRLPVALQDPNTMTTAMSIVDAALSKVRHMRGRGRGEGRPPRSPG